MKLNNNHLYGDISRIFQNSSRCWRSKLEKLDLSGNEFYGHMPQELSELKKLTNLNLRFNKLSGKVPLSVGNLSNLHRLDLSYNSFVDTFSEAHFANMSNLEHLSISFNKFKFKVRLDWMPSFQLKYLMMSSCDIGGKFPQWILTQKELVGLDLSNNSISGTLPKQLYHTNLTTLHLDKNHIMGHIPDNIGRMMPSLQALYLSQNFINGSIPDGLCKMKSLQVLDLTSNYLSGNLPDCWANLQELGSLMLVSNEISGVIPNSIGGAYSLQYLNLKNNSFTGKLPSTMSNCTDLLLLDIGDNAFSGMLPKWIGKRMHDMRALRLRNNKFYGTIPFELCQLLELQILDFGNNNLTGSITHCFGNFSGMVHKETYDLWSEEYSEESLTILLKGSEMEYISALDILFALDLSNNNLVGEIPWELTRLSALVGLNLSHNHLDGEIPGTIRDMKSLGSLDLSTNHLSGRIPNSLSNLDFLGSLNLSYNNLSGQIPTGSHLQTFDDPSIYGGNPGLCGTLLPKKCDAGDVPNSENHVDVDEEDDKLEKIWLYAFVVCGYITGFWIVIGVLVFKRRWSQAFSEFVETRIGRLFGL